MNVRCLGIWLILFAGLPAALGAQASSERTLALRPVHYSLDVSLDFENKSLHGLCRLTVANTSAEPVTSVPLVLFRLLRVAALHDGQGRPLAFRQHVVSFEDWDFIQANFVEADLAAPLAPGDRQVLVIDYSGHITGYAAEGMLYVKDRVDASFTIIRPDGFDYPEVGLPSFKANRAAGLPEFDYDLTVTVPGPQFAANAGQLLAQTIRDGRTTFAYRSVKPSWRIDVAIADYRQHLDPASHLRVFSLAGDEEGARAVLDAVRKSWALFASLLGALPGDAAPFTIIEVPEGYGSQADAACILLTRDAFRDPSQFIQLYHEVSHLWNVKALDPQPPRFESEGLAMFLQYYAQENIEGKTDALSRAEGRILERLRSDFEKDPVAARTAMIDYGRVDRTDFSYTKGMVFFDLLFRLMGKSEFFKALAGFDRRYAADGATSKQFLEWMGRSSSVPLDGLFKDWITGTASTRLILDRLSFDEILKRYQSH